MSLEASGAVERASTVSAHDGISPAASASARPLFRRLVAGIAWPLLRRAARAYVAGETLADALRVQTALASRRRYATLGYWSADDERPAAVARQYLEAIRALEQNGLRGSVSVKLSALQFQADLLAEVAAVALATNVPLHCDSVGPEHADRTLEAIQTWRSAGVEVGLSLPGRWLRSVADARWAVRWGVNVRVVEGQWADPAVPERDVRAGFLEVIDELAGRAKFVSVASHDEPLAATAMDRLRRAGTRCNLELLYGLPMRNALRMAEEHGSDVRIYVGYGVSYLPYALSKLTRQPGLVMRLVKDLLGSESRRIIS